MQNRVPLITVFLEDNETIDYAYNEEFSEIIIQNNRLLYGTLGKIQTQLIELEAEEQTKEENSDEENEDIPSPETEDEID